MLDAFGTQVGGEVHEVGQGLSRGGGAPRPPEPVRDRICGGRVVRPQGRIAIEQADHEALLVQSGQRSGKSCRRV